MAHPSNDTMDRSFLDASIPDLVKKLSIDEKISLLAGQDWWRTVPVPKHNIPAIKVTDGPNGARGDSFYHMTNAVALPNATCIAASFDTELVREAGNLLAAETKARNAVCLLAPTINIQRSPLGGRAFESFSEDPTLSGLIAAAYVNGLQEKGVSPAIKHFVTNDQEHERMGQDSIVSERALREIYLRPFQIAQRLAKPMAYMTSYNKLNGTHCSENDWLLKELLRKEWKHEGLVMSDWYGTYSVSDSINAGLHLEMPGPATWRNPILVKHLLGAHKIDPRQIDKLAGEILTWAQKLAKLNADLVYAKPSPERTRMESKEEDAKLVRRIATGGTVLLKNEGDILPVKRGKVAVIGPNAKAKVITGGGSAQLRAAWSQTPWEGMKDNKPSDVELDYALGCYGAKFLPILGPEFTDPEGNEGFTLSHYNFDPKTGEQSTKPAVTETWDRSELLMADLNHPDLEDLYFTELVATFTPPETEEWEFSLAVRGVGKVWLDDKLVVDTVDELERGGSFFGAGTAEVKGSIKVEKGKKYRFRALHDPRLQKNVKNANTPFKINCLRVGAFPLVNGPQAMTDAIELARKSDTAVIIAGLNADWESEGFDRPDLGLPLRTNELIESVAAVNKNTVVVLQAGSAVSMPWIDKVAGVVYSWYGGNEAGNAIADIVYGKVNPSGRLPLSLPKREQDIAAALNYKSAKTLIRYEEGIWVGYKHHNARGIEPLFPFGHGLSYTSFEYSDLKITKESKKGTAVDDWSLTAEVTVKNVGKLGGTHSVHFYMAPPQATATSLAHPQWSLQAFARAENLGAGQSKVVQVTFDKYAISHWDDYDHTFRVEQGTWAVKVGKDAQTMYGNAEFEVEDELVWTGL